MIEFIDTSYLNKTLKKEIMLDISHIIDSGQYVLGEYLKAFESGFSDYCKTKYCVGLNSGTDALRYSLMALGVTSGDVLTVGFTFPATIMSILSVGANPVFVDVDKHGLMDPENLKLKITKNTRAIIPVHFMGHSCKMKEILEIAEKYNIPVIEDACQAVGALYVGQPVGGIGKIGCFSFFPTKNLSCCGDGGAVVTNDPDLSEKIKLLRNFGRTDREVFKEEGLNSRLDEIQAAILLRKLPYLDKMIEIRRETANLYDKFFISNGIEPLKPPLDTKSSYHLYPIIVKDNMKFIEVSKIEGLDCRIHYSVPSHLQPFMYSIEGKYNLSKTEELSKKVVSIPIHEGIEKDLVLKKLRRIVKNAS